MGTSTNSNLGNKHRFSSVSGFSAGFRKKQLFFVFNPFGAAIPPYNFINTSNYVRQHSRTHVGQCRYLQTNKKRQKQKMRVLVFIFVFRAHELSAHVFDDGRTCGTCGQQHRGGGKHKKRNKHLAMYAASNEKEKRKMWRWRASISLPRAC